jgi:Ca2+-binding RTX toxin-like protein
LTKGKGGKREAKRRQLTLERNALRKPKRKGEGEVRRVLWVTVMGAVLVVVLAGVALAKDIACDGGRCEGTNRADTIIGSDRRDVIFTLDGFDEVFAGAGEDELHGGGGGDDLLGEEDKDTYYGGRDGDSLVEFNEVTSNDVMNGGKGADLLNGGGGDDVLRGEEGSESIGPSFVLIYGGGGNDELYGGKGSDTMDGAEGRDRHYGGEGDDLINAVFVEGEGGRDARDLVDCGRGNDRAVVLPNDRVLGNCEDVERIRVVSGVAAQEAKAAAEEEQQRVLERFLAERVAKR